MEQHPVPQHIASFEFKLFGNLTVRQFITLAIPMGIAAVFFFSNITPFIRLPLALIFGALGLVAALVPVGGRPFDKWIVAFFKAIMSPTLRVWIKEQKLPDYLVMMGTASKPEAIEPSAEPLGREKLATYLKSLPGGVVSPMDVKEQVALSRLDKEAFGGAIGVGKAAKPIFFTQSPKTTAVGRRDASLPQVETVEGMPQMTVGELSRAFGESLPSLSGLRPAVVPRISPHAKAYILSGIENKIAQAMPKHKRGPVELIKTPIAHLASEVNFSIENVISIRTPDRKLKLVPGVGRTRVRKLHFGPPENFDISKLPIRGERRIEIAQSIKELFEDKQVERVKNELKSTIAVPRQVQAEKKPQGEAIKKVPKVTLEQIKQELETVVGKRAPRESKFIPKPTVTLKTPSGVTLKAVEKEMADQLVSISPKKSTKVSFSSILPKAQIVPLTNKPNVISGVIEDRVGGPVEGAILIVRDTNGIPLRALKTNKLGQFLSATSLAEGTYTIEVDSDLVKIELVTVKLSGEVLEPLLISEKGGNNG